MKPQNPLTPAEQLQFIRDAITDGYHRHVDFCISQNQSNLSRKAYEKKCVREIDAMEVRMGRYH